MRVPVRVGAITALALAAAATTLTLSTSSGAASSRTISYDGENITVPASWPVYDLAKDPTQCVRFDRHAVYLGHPGAVQNCPAHLVGRTTALLVEPYDAKAEVTTSATDSGETQEVTSNGKALVTAAYGTGGPQSAASLLRPIPHRSGTPTSKAAATPIAPAAVTPAAIAGTGYGFDTCAAPAASDLQTWRDNGALYRSVGIFIGGANRTCPDGNLSASWVTTVRGLGYTFMPAYVGRQAPCSNILVKMSSNPTLASTNGHDAAVDAILDMQRFGFGSHSPVYMDLEQYQTGNATCSRAVLRFLDAFVYRLHESGYVAGVYMSSVNLPDLVTAHNTKGFHLPDAVWYAHWDGRASVYGEKNLPDNYWAPHKRIHQYLGNRSPSYGGIKLTIDSDYIDGPVG